MGVERINIARMRLRASDRAVLRRAMPDLEDAFRTASWPLLAGAQGVLQVRRLDLGRIAQGASRQALSAQMSQAVRSATIQFCTRPEDVPEGAQILHWRGKVEQLGAALVARMRGSGPIWWADAALGRRAGGPAHVLAQDVDAVVTQIYAQGASGLGAVLLHLAQIGAPSELVMAVVSATRPLLKGLGLSVPTDVAAQSVDAPAVQGRNGAHVPAKMPDPAVALTRLSAAVQSLPAPHRARVQAVLAHVPASPEARMIALALSLSHLRGVASVQRVLEQAKRVAVLREAGAAPRPERAPKPAAAASKRARDTARNLWLVSDAKGHTAPDTPARHPSRAPDTPTPETASHYLSETCAFGGLPILINLIHHATIPAFDALFDQPVALMVLDHFLARLGPDAQILRDALPVPLAPETPEIVRAGLPLLLRAPPTRLSVHRIHGHPGARALCWPRTQSVLGLVTAASLRDFRTAHPDCSLLRVPRPIPRAALIPSLIRGLSLLIQRLCRSVLHQPWRQVVHRPAILALSATHIDVTCDLSEVRIDERRHGLDLSPGWVAWLDRVVALHFEPVRPVVS